MKTISIVKLENARYPDEAPYHPSASYPEYSYPDLGKSNEVYDSVRELLHLLKMDAGNYGSKKWNPLRDIIKPGDNVLVTHNLVIDSHPSGEPGLDASVVHGSIVRAVLDYVFIANKGKGKIRIADSPIKEVDFKKIAAHLGLYSIADYFRSQGIDLEILDLRDSYIPRDKKGNMIERTPLAGDPSGYEWIDLATESLLHPVSDHAKRFRSTASFYENEVIKHHNGKNHRYSIPKSVLESDVLISLAKLKTHRKTGVTLAMKNLVGLTNEKRSLPHHRIGSPLNGGDTHSDNAPSMLKIKEHAREYLLENRHGRYFYKTSRTIYRRLFKRLEKGIATKSNETFHLGNWYRNDTIWRTVLDINRIIRFIDRKGELRNKPEKRCWCLIDGVVAGEGEGPLYPDPKKTGLVIGGENFSAVDWVASAVMGFDPEKIPVLNNSTSLFGLSPDEIRCVSNMPHWNLEGWEKIRPVFKEDNYNFVPTSGWKGHIEL